MSCGDVEQHLAIEELILTIVDVDCGCGCGCGTLGLENDIERSEVGVDSSITGGWLCPPAVCNC